MISDSKCIVIKGEREHFRYAQSIVDLRHKLSLDGNVTTDPYWFAISCTQASQTPVSVLVERDGELVGAVLLREQARWGVPLGYFFACDAAGDEFVISRPGERTTCLRQCLDALLRKSPSAIVSIATRKRFDLDGWLYLKAEAQGAAKYRLVLKATLDETLGQFGAHTRRNLRYYARSLLKKGCTFHPCLSDQQDQEATNALLLHPEFGMTKELLKVNRTALSGVAGNFAMGIRSEEGQWLAYLSGWRSERRTYVLYQMNHTGYRKLSLSTAMRGFLIQHENALESKDISFVSYGNKFFEHGCSIDLRFDLLVAKNSWRMRAFALVASKTLPPDHRLHPLLNWYHT